MTGIRRLGPGDEALVRQLSVEDARFDTDPPDPTAHAALPEQAATRFLADDQTILTVALEGPEPIGFLLAYDLPRRHGLLRMALLYEIGVRSDRRRRGIGRSLLQDLAARCRERGIGEAWVLAEDLNEDAKLFYASCGWKREGGSIAMFERAEAL